MKLLNVAIDNFQGVVEIEFPLAPSGTTILAGANEQGKSSTIGAITAALQGKEELPAEPVRQGQKKSKTVLHLGEEGHVELVVTHEIKEKDDKWVRSLKVENGEGEPQKRPQELLDTLYSRVAFDPSQFAKADPKEQDKILKDLAGVAGAYAELDADRQVIYDARTEKNRQHREAVARASGMGPLHIGVPKEETPALEITKALEAAREHNQARKNADAVVARHETDLHRSLGDVARLEAELAAAREKVLTETATLNDRREAFFALGEDKPTDELEQKLATLDETNAKVRANAAKRAEEKRADALKEEADALTASIEAIDAKKQQLLLDAKFPVEGLGFSDIGPTLNGVPLAQCSTARKLDLSYAVGVALNPKLKLLIMREGAFFDEDSLAHIDQRARADGYQLLVERVGKRDKGAHVFIIEKGLLAKGAATAAE
jgi:hypothetical protein